MFREIEYALREGRVDVGLHCLKDVPTRPPSGLAMAAHLRRENPRDALITRKKLFGELRDGSVIGTGSLRRTSQLAAHSNSFQFKPLMGNIDTRLRKLRHDEYDAIVLAVAGLNRLKSAGKFDPGYEADLMVEELEPQVMMPAAGQATLVLQMSETHSAFGKVSALNDHDTEIASLAERAFLHRFGGGCSVPVGAYSRREDEHFVLDGLISSPDGKLSFRGSKRFGADQAEFYGRELAEELGEQGGFEIIGEMASKTL